MLSNSSFVSLRLYKRQKSRVRQRSAFHSTGQYGCRVADDTQLPATGRLLCVFKRRHQAATLQPQRPSDGSGHCSNTQCCGQLTHELQAVCVWCRQTHSKRFKTRLWRLSYAFPAKQLACLWLGKQRAHFRRVGKKFEKSDLLVSLCLSVRTHEKTRLILDGFFMRFDMWGLFEYFWGVGEGLQLKFY
jgi:hypothetical protein